MKIEPIKKMTCISVDHKKMILNHFARLIALTFDRPDIQNELKKLLVDYKQKRI